MKHLLHIFYLILFSLGLILPTSLLSSQRAQSAESSEFTTCPDDYYSFILSVRSEKTRQQTLKNLFLPYCQLYDILKLEDELDELRTAFRSAAMRCENTTSYKEQYVEILMEQYFIRNIQKGKSDVINTKDAEEYEALKEELLERLKEEMDETFVLDEERVSAATFEDYFEAWSSKYDDRIGDYNQCEDGVWGELKETWDDFVEDLHTAFDFDIKAPEKKSLKEIFVPEVDFDADQDMSALGKSFLKGWEYVKNIANKKKAEIEAAPTVKELSDSGETYTFEAVFTTLGFGEKLYEIRNNSVDRMSRYTQLYGAEGAVAATDMQSILIEVNGIVAESNTKDFPNLITAAAKVYDKQCN